MFSKIYYNEIRQDPILSVISETPTSEVFTYTMLSLLMVGNYKLHNLGGL